MTGKMTQATEARLTEAVSAVADMVAEGSHPTDAVVKVASALGLLPAQVTLVATAYNTGASAAHRKAASTLLDRASAIPLADSLDALTRLFPTAKSADAVRDRFVGRPDRPGVAVRVDAGGTAPLHRLPVKQAYTDPAAGLKALVKQADAARHAAEKEYHRLADKMADLAGYFLRSPSVSFADAWSESVGRHGKVAGDLFAAVQGLYPKVAVIQVGLPMYLRFDQPPHTMVADCLKQAQVCVDRMDEAGDLAAAVETARGPDESHLSPLLRISKTAAGPLGSTGYKGPGGAGGTGGTGPSKSSPKPGGGGGGGVAKPPARSGGSPATSAPTLASRVTGPIAGALEATGIKSMVSGPSPEDIERHRQSVLRAVVDPYSLSEDRGNQTSLLLTDLMASDPIIATHHPSKVMAHYNELAQLAPRLMTQTSAARAALRQRLESGAGGIDPYQIEQLLKAENEIRRRDDPSYGKGILDI